ncbi:universal stress protein [Streptomyces sp. CA-142005]|uniref:universal stress protein n=1 Tax=Streptomyces sp. CA-142005 TaxID=3240052 RepID=UPI003D8FEB17
MVLIPDAIDPVAGPARRVTQVTLGIDARHPAERAIDFAFDAAQVRGVRLYAVHAWELPSCAAGSPFGVPEEDRATWEDHALIHHAEGAALLVVGRGSGGDAGFVQTLLREARCPVSIMPEA